MKKGMVSFILSHFNLRGPSGVKNLSMISEEVKSTRQNCQVPEKFRDPQISTLFLPRQSWDMP